MNQSGTYDAFISYRHLSPDSAVAVTLQRLLETLRVIGPDGKKGAHLHIFRDQSELPASDNLGRDIEEALRNSRFLILICSREYQESVWCMREVELFRLFHGGTGHILPILIDGNPKECFPPCLFEEEINALGQKSMREPLAANICAKSRAGMWSRLFSTEYLRIAAPIVGVPFDRLYQRKKRRRIAAITIAVTAIVALSVGFGIYNANMLHQIESRQQTIYTKEADRLAELAENELENENYPLAIMLAQRAVNFAVQSGNDPESSAAGVSLRSAILQTEYNETHKAVHTRFVIPASQAAGDLGASAVFRNGTVLAFSNLKTISLYDTRTGALLLQVEGAYAALDSDATTCIVADSNGFAGYRVDTGECYFSWSPDIFLQSGTYGDTVLIPVFDSDTGAAYLLTEVLDEESFEFKIETQYSAVVTSDGQISGYQDIPEALDPGNNYELSEQYIRGNSPVLESIESFSETESLPVIMLFLENRWNLDSIQSTEDLPFYIISYEEVTTNSKGANIYNDEIGIFGKNGEQNYIFSSDEFDFGLPTEGVHYISYDGTDILFWYRLKGSDEIHVAELAWNCSYFSDLEQGPGQVLSADESSGWSGYIEVVSTDGTAVLKSRSSSCKVYSAENAEEPLLDIEAESTPDGYDNMLQADKNLDYVIYLDKESKDLVLWERGNGTVFSLSDVPSVTAVGVRADGCYAAAGFSENGQHTLCLYNVSDGNEMDSIILDAPVTYIEIAGDTILAYTIDENRCGMYHFYSVSSDGSLTYIRSITPAGDIGYKILPYMLTDSGLFFNCYVWDTLQLSQICQVETGNVVFSTQCSAAEFNEETGILLYEKGARRQMTSGVSTIYAAKYDPDSGKFKPLYSVLSPAGDLDTQYHSVTGSFFLAGNKLYLIEDGSEYLSMDGVLLRQNQLYAADDQYVRSPSLFLNSHAITVDDSIDSLMSRADEYLTSSNGKREFTQTEIEEYYLIDY